MPRGRLGHTGAKHSLGGARLVRPSHPQLHMLAYKDLTRRRDRRRGSACSAACRAAHHSPKREPRPIPKGGVSGTLMVWAIRRAMLRGFRFANSRARQRFLTERQGQFLSYLSLALIAYVRFL